MPKSNKKSVDLIKFGTLPKVPNTTKQEMDEMKFHLDEHEVFAKDFKEKYPQLVDDDFLKFEMLLEEQRAKINELRALIENHENRITKAQDLQIVQLSKLLQDTLHTGNLHKKYKKPKSSRTDGNVQSEKKDESNVMD